MPQASCSRLCAAADLFVTSCTFAGPFAGLALTQAGAIMHQSGVETAGRYVFYIALAWIAVLLAVWKWTVVKRRPRRRVTR